MEVKYEFKVEGLADGINVGKFFDALEKRETYPKGVTKIFAIPDGPDWATAIQVSIDSNITSMKEVKNYLRDLRVIVGDGKELKSIWRRLFNG
ncbi:MAG: hypothetical protein KW802_02630 [Candidatus Doudnabacteria bacterium]|nr:hypothetical protein [Candidatus Doudnabacteria bacterium]